MGTSASLVFIYKEDGTCYASSNFKENMHLDKYGAEVLSLLNGSVNENDFIRKLFSFKINNFPNDQLQYFPENFSNYAAKVITHFGSIAGYPDFVFVKNNTTVDFEVTHCDGVKTSIIKAGDISLFYNGGSFDWKWYINKLIELARDRMIKDANFIAEASRLNLHQPPSEEE